MGRGLTVTDGLEELCLRARSVLMMGREGWAGLGARRPAPNTDGAELWSGGRVCPACGQSQARGWGLARSRRPECWPEEGAESGSKRPAWNHSGGGAELPVASALSAFPGCGLPVRVPPL